MASRTYGDFGEMLATILLKAKYSKDGVTIINAGREDLPYDLLVPFECKGTPFTKPAAISVKARQEWAKRINTIPPKREIFLQMSEDLSRKGFELWICLIQYSIVNDTIEFSVYFTRANKINPNTDFKKVRTNRKTDEYEIRMDKLKDSAEIIINSTNPK